MPSLKDIRNRITSVSSTMQITSAMKLVSAAKLKKAQDAIEQLRPYSEKMQELLSNISANLDGDAGAEYTRGNESDTILIIAISSNKGLAGAFNSNIVKKVNELIEVEFQEKKVKVITLGKKVFDLFKRRPEFLSEHNNLVDKPHSGPTNDFTKEIVNRFLASEFEKVFLVYNQFQNAAVQHVQVEQMLPLAIQKSDEAPDTDYIYEPEKERIVVDLIPKTISTQTFKAILDSQASEHGARMTAMHKATDNADALKRELTIQYNKARQAAITKEILEIVGGAEALEN